MEKYNIISQSLEYFDKHTNNNKGFLKSINYIRLITNKDNNINTYNYIEFYDKEKELIKKSRYEILGVYNSLNKIWTWGWSIASLNKNSVNTAKKIFNYGFDLDSSNLLLKNELLTSRFKISNPIQLDMHVAIGAYLAKKEIIFSYKIYDDIEINRSNSTPFNDINLLNIKKDHNNSYNLWYLLILD